jgi:hypothetical protein
MRRLGLLLIILGIIGLGSVWMYRMFMRPPQHKALWQNIPASAAVWFYTPSFARTWKNFRSHPLWEVWQKSPHLSESFAQARAWDSLLRQYPTLFEWLGDRGVLVSLHPIGRKWEALYLLEAPFLAKVGDWRGEMASLAQRFGWEVQLVERDGYTLWKLPEGYLAPAGEMLLFSEEPALIVQVLKGQALLASPWDWSPSAWEGRQPILYLGWQGERLAELFGLPALEALRTLTWGEGRLHLTDEGLSLKGYIQTDNPLWQALSPLQHNPPDILPTDASLVAALTLKEPLHYYRTLLLPRYQKEIETAEKWLGLSFEESFIQHLSGDVILSAIPQPILLLRLRDAPAFSQNLNTFHRRLRSRTPLRNQPVAYRGYLIHHLEVKGLFRWLLGKYFASWEAPYLVQVGDWVVIARQPEPLQAFIRATIERRFLSERLSWSSLPSQEKIAFGLYIDARAVEWLPAFLPASTIATWQTELAPWESGAFAIGPSESGRLRYELLLRLAPPSAPPPQQTTTPALSLPTPDREDSLQEEYYPNGVLKKRAFLVNSQLEGEYVEYHPNGLIKVQGYYEQGKKVGIWRYYDKKGTLLREETWSADTTQ